MKDYYEIGRSLRNNGATATPKLDDYRNQQKIDAGYNRPTPRPYTPPPPPPPRDTKR